MKRYLRYSKKGVPFHRYSGAPQYRVFDPPIVLPNGGSVMCKHLRDGRVLAVVNER